MAAGSGPPTPEGWYDDPEDPTALRWWDGLRWADQRRPKPTVAPPPAPAAAPSPSSDGATERRPLPPEVEAQLAALVATVPRTEGKQSDPRTFLVATIGMAAAVVVWSVFIVISNRRADDAQAPTGPVAAVADAADAAVQGDLTRAATTVRLLVGEAGTAAPGPQQLQQAEPALAFGPPGSASVDVIAVQPAPGGAVYLTKATPSGEFLCIQVQPNGRRYGRGTTEVAAVTACTAPAWT